MFVEFKMHVECYEQSRKICAISTSVRCDTVGRAALWFSTALSTGRLTAQLMESTYFTMLAFHRAALWDVAHSSVVISTRAAASSSSVSGCASVRAWWGTTTILGSHSLASY